MGRCLLIASIGVVAVFTATAIWFFCEPPPAPLVLLDSPDRYLLVRFANPRAYVIKPVQVECSRGAITLVHVTGDRQFILQVMSAKRQFAGAQKGGRFFTVVYDPRDENAVTDVCDILNRSE